MAICIENVCTLSSTFLVQITSNFNSRSLIGIIIVKHTVLILYIMDRQQYFTFVHDSI